MRRLVLEPSPRANPSGSLYEQWRLRDGKRVVLRASSRDALEARINRSKWRERTPS